MVKPRSAAAVKGARGSRLVEGNLETMLAEARAESDSGAGLPQFVEREFRDYLTCGILAHGFLRLRCGGCGDSQLIAFSCKRRAICPSCAHRRMQDGAAHLIDQVLPELPYRQWVISFPKRIRLHLATDHTFNSKVLALSLREISKWQRRGAKRLGHAKTRTAAVVCQQRFGSALQLNPHGHLILPDGVFSARDEAAPHTAPVFIPIDPPGDEDIQLIVLRIATKVTALAERLGLWDRPISDASAALAKTIALPLPGARPKTDEPRRTGRREAFFRGYSLHANVFCHQNDRPTLARVVRYCLRPPFALDRMSLLPDGRVEYKMKRALPDGSTSLILSPTDFLRRIASLVPPPRKHLTTYFGLFAPFARDRKNIVPRTASPSAPSSHLPDPSPPTTAPPTSAPHPTLPAVRPRPPSRLPWGELLQPVYAVDVFHCALCGGHRRIIAAITDPGTAQRILASLGLPSLATTTLPSRAPPQLHLPTSAPDFYPDPPSPQD